MIRLQPDNLERQEPTKTEKLMLWLCYPNRGVELFLAIFMVGLFCAGIIGFCTAHN